MKASDWQVWLNSLPSTPTELHALSADLTRHMVVTEAQWQAALWSDDRPQARLARIRLTELNSQLLVLQTRIQMA